MLEAIFKDEFNRTTSSGLGTYGSTTYASPTGDDNCHVNGSYVVSNVAFGFSRYVGMPRVVTGAVQFDFWVGSTTDGNVTYEVDGGWELQPASGRYYHLLGKAVCNGDGTFTISGFGRIIFSFAVTSNTWYRMRVEWDGTTERVKCWKVANPEPSTWGSTGTTTQFGGGPLTITSSGTPKIEINGPSSSAREVRLDNIVIWDTFGATLAFSDDFHRTVGTGLGGNWAYTTDDSSQPAPGIMSVDGDVAHVAAGEFESQTNPDIPYASQGYVRWDFLIPANIHDTPQMGFNFAAGTFYVGNPNGTSVWRAFRSDVIGAYVEFSPAASEWWTVWFWFGSGTDYVKVWPRDAPGEEPEWTTIPHTPGVPGTPAYGLLLLDAYYAPTAEDQLFDNLFVWTSGPATQTGSFTLASEIARRSWNLDAIAKATGRGLFDLEAMIAQGWRFDAWIRRAPGQFAVDAIVQSPISGSFPLSAEVATVAPVVFLLDATIGIRHPGSFALKAWVVPVPFHTSSFDLAAFIIGSLGAFALDAQVSSPQAHADSFGLSAEVSVTYRQSGFSVAAVALVAQSGVFDLEAIVLAAGTRQSGSFGLNARAAGRIALDAFVGYSFQLGAEIRNPAQEFGVSAWIGRTGYGWFAFDAIAANGSFAMDAIVKAVRGDIIPFIASVIRRPSASFGLDARVAGAFSLDAYVQPGFNLSAEISSGNDGQKYWPPGSGGPGNPGPVDGGTGQPWRPPHHQARIEILIDDVEVTKHVELAGCNFTQAAGNSPGTFSLPMKGVFTKYNGGEEVIVRIDGFRQFGGIVVAATHGFHYPYVAGENGDVDHPNEQPITVLQGTDFNVLFDRVQIYNVPWVTANGPSGDYEPIDPLPKDHSDRFYIQTIFAKYIDTVWRKQFGYNEYVEEAAVHPSPETPFTVETGQTLRVFLSALSAVTNQIWYFDPYYELHSHSRANANAPRAITDGTGADSGGDPTGGIHCRDLTVVWSIEDMADDTFVFGTLAETVEGEIIFDRRRDPDNIAEFGLWQYMEVRSDLHLQEHVDQRGYALSVRSDRRIHRAQCRIYEKGFQAGQVVSLFSGEYGVAENIPIAQVTMTFAVSQGAEDGRYYGVPVYDLTMSNEPDPPWNLYDALPWQTKDFGPSPSLPGFGWRMPHLQLRNDGPGPQVAPCRDEDWQTIWSGCGSTRTLHAQQQMTLITDPLSPPPWCVVLHMPANNPGFVLRQVMVAADDSPYLGKASFGGALAKIGPTWFVTVGAPGQNEDNLPSDPGSQVAVAIDPTLETYARVKVLEDGSMYARVWQTGSSEPTEWQATATYVQEPDFLPSFVVGMQLASRLELDAHQLTEFIVAGKPGSGFAWIDPLRTDEFATFRKIYSPYQPWTWGTIRYPAGTRPVVNEGDGGNVLDANAYPYLFPRGETWEVYPRSLYPGSQSSEHNLHRYVWDWAFVPGTGDGAPDEPRMLTDSHNYIGFIPPPGATRVTFKARVYVNVYLTGLFGVGEQPQPSGEGAIPFEVWVTDYRGQPAEPDHNVIYTNVQPDYNWQDNIVWAYDVEWSQVVHSDAAFQIGGKLTIDPQFLINSRKQGALLNNGLKRVLELKMTDVSLRFEWDPLPCGDGVLGNCIDPNDDPYWETGWGQEMTAADKTTGAFTARLSVAPATLSVFAHGTLLIPDTDYTADGDADHRNYHLVAPGARCLRLVYLANTATVTTEPPQGGPGTGDRIPNRTTQPDIRGIGQ